MTTGREAGINPKLLAIAAKIDEAKALCAKLQRQIKTFEDEKRFGPDATGKKICDLEEKLAKVAATNLEELELKARYVFDCDIQDPVAKSIIRNLLAMDRKAEAAGKGNNPQSESLKCAD